jgi:hypothetical protein
MAVALGQSLPFVHPHFVGAALALGAIPIVIHLINRRRYRRVPWAAMNFLLAANKQSVRRMRLEQLLLLLLRVAVVVLLGLAVARPYASASALLGLGTSRVHHVVLLDNSRSMGAVDAEGRSRYARAAEAAQELLNSFPETDAVSLITLAQPADAAIGHAAYDRRFVRKKLSDVTPTQRATDTAGGFAKAMEILEASELRTGNQAVYLISDMPQVEWHAANAAPVSPTAAAARRLIEAADVDLRIWSMAESAPPANLAVTRLEAESSLIGVNIPFRVRAEVTNFGDESVRGRILQMLRDGQIVGRIDLPAIAPQASAPATMTIVLPTSVTHVLEARLTGGATDALADDDARFLSVEAKRAVGVLLVDGRPGRTPFDGQAGYLAAALAPRVSAADVTLIAPKIISEIELATETLLEYDVIALCNVQRLAAEQWRALDTFVTDGGGLLVFAGDQIGVENYNRFGYAGGDGPLPGQFAAGSTQPTPPTAFRSDSTAHPIVSDFAGQAASGLFLARVSEYLPFRADPARGEVVLHYTDGEAAIVLARRGLGKTAVVTTSANMDWTNLPAKGDFVSLMGNLVSNLTPRRGDRRNLSVGATLTEPLSATESAMPVQAVAPGGGAVPGKVAPVAGGLAFECGPIEEAGILRVAVGLDVRHFAVNVDPADSDIRFAERESIERALGRRVVFLDSTSTSRAASAGGRSSEMAASVFGLVLALLVIEAFAAMRFSTHQRGG